MTNNSPKCVFCGKPVDAREYKLTLEHLSNGLIKEFWVCSKCFYAKLYNK